MFAITVNPDTYTRRNNDAAIAGAIVSMFDALMTLKYQKEVTKFGLIHRYNFVGIPDKVWPAYNLYAPIIEATCISAEYLNTLIQVKEYNDPE